MKGLTFIDLAQAIYERRKTQTRRLRNRLAVGEEFYVKECWALIEGVPHCPWPGLTHKMVPEGCIVYRAAFDRSRCFKWRSSMVMPAWAARSICVVTDVRAERLQEITEEDAAAEGFLDDGTAVWWEGFDTRLRDSDGYENWNTARGDSPPEWMRAPIKRIRKAGLGYTAKDHFRVAWNCCYVTANHVWEVNPWVWAYTFERREGR